MTTWFRTYYEGDDLWLYFEANDEGWAARQVEVRAQDSRPVVAASLEEVLHLRDHADLAAMFRYERRYGVLAEGSMEGWQASRRRPRSPRRSSSGCGLKHGGLSAIQPDLASRGSWKAPITEPRKRKPGGMTCRCGDGSPVVACWSREYSRCPDAGAVERATPKRRLKQPRLPAVRGHR
ncbi:MAG TPA: hypothetical protein VGE95_04815 [Arthrobacter sp.]